MAPKRRATSPIRPPAPKKRELSPPPTNGASNIKQDDPQVPYEEASGIVQRAFYPPEMSNERCAAYNNNEIPRPLTLLNQTLASTQQARDKISPGACVVHWFKRDLRLQDNRGLSLASKKAQAAGIPLVCVFIVSPQDYEAHVTSAARVDFELRTLQVMKADLEELEVPLYTATIDKRRDVIPHLLQRFKEWGAKHVFCNIEYEVDELRRETKLVKQCLEADISFTALHDDVVVPPETLVSGAGKQYSVYSPWFKAWIRHLHAHPHLLNEHPLPSANLPSAKTTFASLFTCPIPPAPPNKTLSPPDRTRLTALWPAGEAEAQARLTTFLSTKIKPYKETRNLPSLHSTALLSVHFSAGTLASRTAVRLARATNSPNKSLDAGNPGITTWISELAWRDFYKHVLAHWPYVCMSKPFKYEYTSITWETSPSHFQAWCDGKTGYPIIDAAMRQLNEMGWMHNRCRMITASFLAKDLLLDWRLGERYFMERLIDGDFASNNGGWGFSASTGVDPQPYFRIFNPLLQSEKFDPEGGYIRKWVPELRGVEGRAVHDPYGRGAGGLAAKAGYPKPVVEHRVARERALARYKEGLGRSTANVGGGVHN